MAGQVLDHEGHSPEGPVGRLLGQRLLEARVDTAFSSGSSASTRAIAASTSSRRNLAGAHQLGLCRGIEAGIHGPAQPIP